MSNSPSAAAVEAAAPKAPGLRYLLANHNFRNLYFGQVISDFGDNLANLALLVLVTKLTGSTAALATMFIALAVPQIAFGMLAGVYVDRLDRKRVMLASDLLRGLLVLGFVLVGSKDTLWLMYVIAFLQSGVGTFFNPARQAIIPRIVEGDSLLAANSVSQTSRVIFGLLGTATAGVLIGTLNVYWPLFVADAVTFFFSFAMISRLRVPGLATAEGAPQAAGGAKAVYSQLADGIKLIFHTPALKGTLVAAGVLMLGIGAVNVLVIPLIINDLKVPATWFGAVEFAQTAAMILSGSLFALVATRVKPTAVISGTLVGIGLGVAGLSLVTSVWHIFPILFVVGLMVTPLNASIATLLQTSVSDNMRGRIGAALNTLISSCTMISMAAAGAFAEFIGVRNVFVLGGAIVLLSGAASAWTFRSHREASPETAPLTVGERAEGGEASASEQAA